MRQDKIRQMDGQIYRQIGRQRDGWMDGWIDRQLDRQIDRQTGRCQLSTYSMIEDIRRCEDIRYQIFEDMRYHILYMYVNVAIDIEIKCPTSDIGYQVFTIQICHLLDIGQSKISNIQRSQSIYRNVQSNPKTGPTSEVF